MSNLATPGTSASILREETRETKVKVFSTKNNLCVSEKIVSTFNLEG